MFWDYATTRCAGVVGIRTKPCSTCEGGLRRAAMERTEPAMIDLWGATWEGRDSYRLQPGAQRYEFYEKDFAGIVRASHGPAPESSRPRLGTVDVRDAWCFGKACSILQGV